MSRRFNMSQAATILGTNPKTFKVWLKQDDIDIENQLNRADSREKYVTSEQILAMANKREIEVRLPDERRTESTSARILAGVDERLAGLKQEFTGRVEQLAAKEIPALVDELRRYLEQQLTHHFDQLDAYLERLEQRLAELEHTRASAPAPKARNATHPSTPAAATHPTPLTRRPQPARRNKKKTKARKNLPKTYIPLATMRQLHAISEKAVDIAVQRNKLTVMRGAWAHQHRAVTLALDPVGRRQFYELFSGREGFTRCNGCPHAAS